MDSSRYAFYVHPIIFRDRRSDPSADIHQESTILNYTPHANDKLFFVCNKSFFYVHILFCLVSYVCMRFLDLVRRLPLSKDIAF